MNIIARRPAAQALKCVSRYENPLPTIVTFSSCPLLCPDRYFGSFFFFLIKERFQEHPPSRRAIVEQVFLANVKGSDSFDELSFLSPTLARPEISEINNYRRSQR